jgi:hypothetical protein
MGKELNLYGMKGDESKGENGHRSISHVFPLNERIESLTGAEK